MTLKISHEELKQIIKEFYKKKLALFVWGSFGLGKSRVILDSAKEIAKERERTFCEWNKLDKKGKKEVFNSPEKYFLYIDIRGSEMDSCLSKDMLINLWDGGVKKIKDIQKGDKIIGYNKGKVVESKVVKKWDKGISQEGIVKIYLKNGEIIEATKQHKFLTKQGWKETKDLKTTNILCLQNRKEFQNGQRKQTREKLHKRRKELYKGKLQNQDSKRNSKNFRQKTKKHNRTGILNENKENALTLHQRTKRNNQKELRQNEGKGFSENVGKKYVGIKFIRQKGGISKNLQTSNKRNKNTSKQSNRSGKRIFSRDNRWGRNDMYWDKIKQQHKNNDLQTTNINQQHRRKINRMVQKECNPYENTNLQKKTQQPQNKNKLHNGITRIQNITHTQKNISLPNNQKKQVQNFDRMDRKKKKQNLGKPLLRKGKANTSFNQKREFEQVEIQRIDYTNENKPIFDLTTTTGNYLVKNIVCHNSDIKGLPKFFNNSDMIEWAIPMWAKVMTLPNSDGILSFEELNLSTPLVMSSFYKTIYDRFIGEEAIEKSWLVLGCGNLESDHAFIHPTPIPLLDRAGECELQVPSVEEWTHNFAIPNKIDSRIIGYLNFKETNLQKINFSDNQKQTTCRGWERVSNLIKGVKDYKTIELLCKSAIGEGIAISFIAFLKIQEKMKLDDVIKHPEKIEKIDKPDIKYFLVSAVAEKYSDKKNNQVDFDKVIEISQILDACQSAEFVALMWRLCISYAPEMFKKEFLNSKGIDDFVNRYGKFIV